MTDGNLARHLQVLEQAKLVDVEKDSERDRPHTTYRVSRQRRKRCLEYFAVLEQVVLDAAAAIAVVSDSKGEQALASG